MSSLNRRSVAVWLAAALVACRKREREPHDFGKVFSGFDFVGDFPVKDIDLESHPHESAGLPELWVPGPQYVFHLEDQRDFEEIPTRLLPQRLRSVGATVVYAPRSWGDMGVPNTGNLIWDIEFTQGGFRGHIRNRVDMKRLERFSRSVKMRRNLPDPRIDDYVLSLSI